MDSSRETYFLGWKVVVVVGLLAWWVGVRWLDEEVARGKRPAAAEPTAAGGEQAGEEEDTTLGGGEGEEEEGFGEEEEHGDLDDPASIGGGMGRRSRRDHALWTKVEEDFSRCPDGESARLALEVCRLKAAEQVAAYRTTSSE